MPTLGCYFVTATGGWVASVIRFATHSPVNHAGIYVGSGRVMEAQPGGARLVPVDRYPNAIWSTAPLDSITRQRIAFKALTLRGTPYSWLDIVALGYTKLLGRATPPFIRHRVERSDRLICSQLVDVCYLSAGVHLFTDGRPTEDVTPGDLYDLIREG